ncbi:MAG: hypothetical protein KC475_03165 [Cyanobacteria bacterium HKST-UBA03]|nr:hypothetical protein [Cyanobacteria bacterium HKST-UBA03]
MKIDALQPNPFQTRQASSGTSSSASAKRGATVPGFGALRFGINEGGNPVDSGDSGDQFVPAATALKEPPASYSRHTVGFNGDAVTLTPGTDGSAQSVMEPERALRLAETVRRALEQEPPTDGSGIAVQLEPVASNPADSGLWQVFNGPRGLQIINGRPETYEVPQAIANRLKTLQNLPPAAPSTSLPTSTSTRPPLAVTSAASQQAQPSSAGTNPGTDPQAKPVQRPDTLMQALRNTDHPSLIFREAGFAPNDGESPMYTLSDRHGSCYYPSFLIDDIKAAVPEAGAHLTDAYDDGWRINNKLDLYRGPQGSVLIHVRDPKAYAGNTASFLNGVPEAFRESDPGLIIVPQREAQALGFTPPMLSMAATTILPAEEVMLDPGVTAVWEQPLHPQPERDEEFRLEPSLSDDDIDPGSRQFMDTDGRVVNRYGQPIPEDAIDYSLIDTSQRIDPEMLGPMRKEGGWSVPADEPAFSPTGVTQDYIPVDPGLTVDTPTMGALKAVDDNPQPQSNRYKANAMVARLESGPGNDWAFGIVDDFATAHSHPAGDRSVEEAVQAKIFEQAMAYAQNHGHTPQEAELLRRAAGNDTTLTDPERAVVLRCFENAPTAADIAFAFSPRQVPPQTYQTLLDSITSPAQQAELAEQLRTKDGHPYPAAQAALAKPLVTHGQRTALAKAFKQRKPFDTITQRQLITDEIEGASAEQVLLRPHVRYKLADNIHNLTPQGKYNMLESHEVYDLRQALPEKSDAGRELRPLLDAYTQALNDSYDKAKEPEARQQMYTVMRQISHTMARYGEELPRAAQKFLPYGPLDTEETAVYLRAQRFIPEFIARYHPEAFKAQLQRAAGHAHDPDDLDDEGWVTSHAYPERQGNSPTVQGGWVRRARQTVADHPIAAALATGTSLAVVLGTSLWMALSNAGKPEPDLVDKGPGNGLNQRLSPEDLAALRGTSSPFETPGVTAPGAVEPVIPDLPPAAPYAYTSVVVPHHRGLPPAQLFTPQQLERANPALKTMTSPQSINTEVVAVRAGSPGDPKQMREGWIEYGGDGDNAFLFDVKWIEPGERPSSWPEGADAMVRVTHVAPNYGSDNTHTYFNNDPASVIEVGKGYFARPTGTNPVTLNYDTVVTDAAGRSDVLYIPLAQPPAASPKLAHKPNE